MSLYLDVSEFLKNPITTGIQRIAGQLCRHMPAGAAVPVRHYRGRYVAFTSELILAIGTYFGEPTEGNAQKIWDLGAPEIGRPIALQSSDVVLVPEVIIRADRLDFLSQMPDREFELHRFLIYDLLPLTHPQLFWSSWMSDICRYYKLLRKSSHCSFISEATKHVFYRRLKRCEDVDGIVMPLGADSLGPRVSKPNLDRGLVFTVLGTIEPRKNHRLILEAFEPLLGTVPGLVLRFVGKIGWIDAEFASKVQRLGSDPASGFRLEEGCSDEQVADFVRESRATIYVSDAEGFGLPPLESLWLGTPVIASDCIPSLERIGEAGVHVLRPADVVNLRRAVLAFCEDSYMREKIRGAISLRLPSWHSFTADMLAWCAVG
jgi:glycosyltransferase involved in cell wall biosynthesis